jgi:feruloyl esterase
MALSVLSLAACGGAEGPPPATATTQPAAAPAAITVSSPAASCAALASVTVPAAAIGLSTQGATITAATLQAADSTTGLPEYCKVLGNILATNAADPPIKFQLNLPTTWNVKALQYGGGGFNGTVITGLGNVAHGPASSKLPLASGYATYGGDSGHAPSGGTFFTNAQATANYGGQSVKRTRDAAVFLVNAYYKAAPWKVYYQGSSKGGQEGLHASQDYGSDFDGVVSYYPAAQNQSLVLSWYRMWQAAYRSAGGYLNPAKQQLLKAQVLQVCDGLDGVADGIVSNTTSCAHTFNVGAMRCPGGVDAGDTCLSDAQINTLQMAATPMTFAFPLANGITSAGPYPIFQGADVSPWLDATGVGTATGYFAFNDGTIKYFFYGDAAATSEGFDYRLWQPKVEQMSSIFDASNPDIDVFRKRGGKLLMVQGTTDMLVPSTMTTAYYTTLASRYGSALPDFVRYFVVPGFAHGAGDFRSTWDSLSALEAWVEKGIAPANQVVVDAHPATAGRSRPLCEYPNYPKYVGSGDPNNASSFTCTPL